MPVGTKIILAIGGLLVGVLVVYYGFMMPDSESDPGADPGGDLVAGEPGIQNEANTPPAENDPSGELVLLDDGATRPRGLFNAPVGNGGLDPLSSEPSPPVIIDPVAGMPDTGDTIPSVTMGSGDARSTMQPPVANAPAALNPTATDRPRPEPVADRPPIPVDYTIRDGDTLIAISADWFGDPNKWDLIVAANPGLDPRRMRIGQRIKLPPRDATRTTVTPAAEQSRVYVVQSGDTLSGLAQRYYRNGGLWERIFTANRLTLDGDPDALKVGMRLVIPPAP